MDEFLRDGIWQFVGAALALIAIVITVLIFLRQRQKKSFAYELISNTSLLSVAEEIEHRVQIMYEGEHVQWVHLFVLKLINNGNVPILVNDFDRPVEIAFGESTTILSADVSEERPENIDAELDVEDHTIKLEPVLLNSGDSITITCLLNNYDGKFDVKGRIVGVKKFKQVTPRVYVEGAVNLGMALMILFFLFLILFVVFKPSWGLSSLRVSGIELIIFSWVIFLIWRMANKAFGRDLR